MKDLGDYNGLIYNESDLIFFESFFSCFSKFFCKKRVILKKNEFGVEFLTLCFKRGLTRITHIEYHILIYFSKYAKNCIHKCHN